MHRRGLPALCSTHAGRAGPQAVRTPLSDRLSNRHGTTHLQRAQPPQIVFHPRGMTFQTPREYPDRQRPHHERQPLTRFPTILIHKGLHLKPCVSFLMIFEPRTLHIRYMTGCSTCWRRGCSRSDMDLPEDVGLGQGTLPTARIVARSVAHGTDCDQSRRPAV